MDRTLADKLESNALALKNVLDNYYMGRAEDKQAVKDLTARLFALAHGYDPTDTDALIAELERRGYTVTYDRAAYW